MWPPGVVPSPKRSGRPKPNRNWNDFVQRVEKRVHRMMLLASNTPAVYDPTEVEVKGRWPAGIETEY